MRLAAIVLAATAVSAWPVFRRQDAEGATESGGEGDAAAVPDQCGALCTPLIPILMTCKPNDCGACAPDRLQQLTNCYTCMGAASNVTISSDIANDMVKQLCGDGVQVTLGASAGVPASSSAAVSSGAGPAPTPKSPADAPPSGGDDQAPTETQTPVEPTQAPDAPDAPADKDTPADAPETPTESPAEAPAEPSAESA